MAEIQIYDMATNATPNDDDFFEQDIVDLDLPAGRNNKKISLGATADFIAKTHNYTSDLQTTNKTIVGAINEVLNEGTSVSVTNVLPATETTKRVATITVDGVAKDVNADDADKILRAAFGEHTVSGNPVSVDAFLGLEVPSSCKVTMNPIQDLSHGDPSPTNICPISGRTEVSVTRTGANQWDEVTQLGYLDGGTGTVYPSYTDRLCSKNFCECIGNHDYYCKNGHSSGLTIVWYDKNQVYIRQNSFNNNVLTSPANAKYYKLGFPSNYGTTYNNNVSLNYISTDTDYHAYTAETHTHQYGQTVYGGEDDFVNGGLTNEWGYIASYNGETLPSEWVSDRDVYQAGTTPTTGAEVAYKLATPTTIQTSAENISLLKGTNVVSTDGDDIEMKYSADIKAYIDSKLA